MAGTIRDSMLACMLAFKGLGLVLYNTCFNDANVMSKWLLFECF